MNVANAIVEIIFKPIVTLFKNVWDAIINAFKPKLRKRKLKWYIVAYRAHPISHKRAMIAQRGAVT
jgi:hypothetical protein